MGVFIEYTNQLYSIWVRLEWGIPPKWQFNKGNYDSAMDFGVTHFQAVQMVGK